MILPGMYRPALLVAMMMTFVKGDIFTSIAKLKPLVATEDQLLKDVQDYLHNERQRLNNIESMITQIRSERSTPSSNEPSVNLGHPIQSFQLLRRLRKQWFAVKDYVSSTEHRNSYLDKFEKISLNQYPSEDDYLGATEALLRLQETYKLQTSSLANGTLLGEHHSTPLLADDCFEVGRLATTVGTANRVLEWMTEAQLRQNQSKTNRYSKAAILEQIASALYKQGQFEEAVENIYEIVKLDPNNAFAAKTKTRYERELKFKQLNDFSNEAEDEMYGALCRGEETVYKKPKMPSKLRCRYANYGRPRLFIRPAKEEFLFDEPKIVYYHDIITNVEIELLKQRALPVMKRSGVSTVGETSKKRISSVAWLDIFDSEDLLGKILPRVQDYTGLSTKKGHTELFQVMNYGLGGFYDYHYDDETDGVDQGFQGMGKRIATVLFYLSDVDAGGATVFTKAGVRVSPVKGSAVVWHNYLKNGDRDLMTRHAGCPVLMGMKWASNLWIREFGQVFRRRCGLTQDDKY